MESTNPVSKGLLKKLPFASTLNDDEANGVHNIVFSNKLSGEEKDEALVVLLDNESFVAYLKWKEKRKAHAEQLLIMSVPETLRELLSRLLALDNWKVIRCFLKSVLTSELNMMLSNLENRQYTDGSSSKTDVGKCGLISNAEDKTSAIIPATQSPSSPRTSHQRKFSTSIHGQSLFDPAANVCGSLQSDYSKTAVSFHRSSDVASNLNVTCRPQEPPPSSMMKTFSIASNEKKSVDGKILCAEIIDYSQRARGTNSMDYKEPGVKTISKSQVQYRQKQPQQSGTLKRKGNYNKFEGPGQKITKTVTTNPTFEPKSNIQNKPAWKSAEEIHRRESNMGDPAPSIITIPTQATSSASSQMSLNSQRSDVRVPTTGTGDVSSNFSDISSTSKAPTLTYTKNCTNILLLGETGVGKTTFVNAFANYAHYSSFEAALSGGPLVVSKMKFSTTDKEYNSHSIVFESNFDTGLVDMTSTPSDNENLTTGESATQSTSSYVFQLKSNSGVRWNFRIIDTPGMGDTRGREQDLRNRVDIAHFCSVRNIRVHAICILLSPNKSRLTPCFENSISILFTRLQSLLSETYNIFFCFTHARETHFELGESLPLVRVLLDNLNKKDIHVSSSNTFMFDNESLRFLCMKELLSKDVEIRHQCHQSWKNSQEEALRFIQLVSSLNDNAISKMKMHYTYIISSLGRLMLDNAKKMVASDRSYSAFEKQRRDRIVLLAAAFVSFLRNVFGHGKVEELSAPLRDYCDKNSCHFRGDEKFEFVNSYDLFLERCKELCDADISLEKIITECNVLLGKECEPHLNALADRFIPQNPFPDKIVVEVREHLLMSTAPTQAKPKEKG